MAASKKAILDVGREASFQKLRRELLTASGFEVSSAGSFRGVKRLGAKRFHAVVIGAWVSPQDRDQIVQLVRARNPEASVVFYYDGKIEGTELADAILNCHGDHADLVRILEHLFSKQKDGGKGGGTTRRLAAIAVTIASGFLNLISTLAWDRIELSSAMF